MAPLPGYTIQYRGKNREVLTPDGEIISYGAYRNLVSQDKGFESRYAETKAGKPIEYTSARGEKQIAYDIGTPRNKTKVIEGISGQYDRNVGIAIAMQYRLVGEGTEGRIQTIQSPMYKNTRGNIPHMIADLQVAADKSAQKAIPLGYFVILYPERDI